MKTIAQQLNITEFPYIIKDENGKIVYYENSEGFWIKREYDSEGNKIYHENSEGYWIKREYDSKGNQIYSKNSEDYWTKYEFDSQGNEIYYENSEGYWAKWEYDSNGNQIYYENSDGVIEDKRPEKIKIQEYIVKYKYSNILRIQVVDVTETSIAFKNLDGNGSIIRMLIKNFKSDYKIIEQIPVNNSSCLAT